MKAFSGQTTGQLLTHDCIRLTAELNRTEDVMEARRAFVEKRKSVYHGR